MIDDHEEASYDLVMPFIVCESEDGPYDDESFVAGWYFGELGAHLHMAKPTSAVLSWWVPTPLVPQLDLLAAHHGYTMTAEPWEEHPEEWTDVVFERATVDPDIEDFENGVA